VAHPQIAAFARMAKENSPPARLIAGQKTLLSRTMHDIRYDAVNDEFLVTNPFAQAIMVYRGAANGEEAPVRVIVGPKTQISGSAYAGVDRLDVDPIHNEILVPTGNSILVFPRTAQGDVAPIRVIKGPDTMLRAAQTLAVDPVNNVIIASFSRSSRSSTEGARADGGSVGLGGLAIFNRTDNGNVKPQRVIIGPKTGIVRINQMQAYSPKSLVVAAMPGAGDAQEPEGVFIGVWSIHDNGDVAPRWKIAGPKSVMKKPRGVVLNPKNKELIVSDMRLNAVLTYYFPEMF
jgi:hypothetical protein